MAAEGSTAGPSIPPVTLKILLIGSSAVGKSSIMLRFTDEVFLSEDETTATLGVDQRVKVVERAGKRWKLTIWDTAGQERFRTLTSSYYRGAMACLMVYDISNRQSFDALPSWFAELETFAGTEVIRAVVGNKDDREESARTVSAEEGQALAEVKGASFVEVSAKQGRGVEELFESVIDRILEKPELYNAAKRNLASSALPGSYSDAVKLDATDSTSGWGCRC